MRAASQLASRSERHHGGVRSKRAGGGEESRGAVSGGRSGSHRHRQVQAGHRDREAVQRGDNQRRLHAGKEERFVEEARHRVVVFDGATTRLGLKQNETKKNSAYLPE